MNLSMICRFDSSGLGNMSWEFARHLKPRRILLVSNGVYQTFPERYEGFETRIAKVKEPDAEDQAWILDGADVLLSIETFYADSLMSRARRRGVKTALVTMYEMQQENPSILPDLFICPSTLDLEVYRRLWPGVPAVYLPPPIATDRLPWRERREALRLVHTASHGGLRGRKGTGILLEAMRHVRNPDVRLTVYSWKPIPNDDPRVTIEFVNFKNYWQLWREGDVLVYPQGANGISLPCAEAYASGLLVLTTDQRPFNEWLPKGVLFPHGGMRTSRMGANLIPVEDPQLSPLKLAEKIDEVAAFGPSLVSMLSKSGKRWATRTSWRRLLPDYVSTLNELASKP